MGILSKIFRNKRPVFESIPTPTADDVFQPQVADYQFDKQNVRFVIYRDHDLKGRSVLFDSLNDGQLNQQKPYRSSDLKKLADMMFGTLPLFHKSTTFKVHTTKSPPQLMITKVFIPQQRNRESTNDFESFDLYSIESLSGDDHGYNNESSLDIRAYRPAPMPEVAHSMPHDVPFRDFGGCLSHEDDLQLSVASSSHSPVAPSVCSSMHLSSSYNSRFRRIMRHKTTTIEHLLTSSLSDEKPDPVPLHKRPTKIGIAVLFRLPEESSPVNRSFQSFFFSHIMLIENYVHQLKDAIDRALTEKNSSIRIELIYQAIDVFLGSISSLYKAPRLKDPAWLSMMTYSTCRLSLSSRFLKDFMMLVDRCHTKNTKFFLGVLLTAVLTHHLSWAPTVAPVEETPSQTYLDKHAAKWVNTLVRSHPYNPLWAQLGDLYGAIGVPLCLSRTVVVGRKSELVSTVLFILSYFIRCSEILENVESFPVFSDDHSCSSSETSSLAHDDDITLKSPITESKEFERSTPDSAFAGTVSSSVMSDGEEAYENHVESSSKNINSIFNVEDSPVRCLSCSETESARTPMLFVDTYRAGLTQSHAYEENVLSQSGHLLVDGATSRVEKTDDGRPLLVSTPAFSAEKTKKSLLAADLERCRLKEDHIIEIPKIENVRYVKKAASEHNTLAMPAPQMSKKVPMLRGNSIFDEYFDMNDPDLVINLPLENSFKKTMHHLAYDDHMTEEILDESCPVVSHLNQLSRQSTACDTGIDLNECTQLYSRQSTACDTGIDLNEYTQVHNEHFGDIEIAEIANLPDGPSKQILCKAISMLQDQFTSSGLTLEGDRLCSSGDSILERSERSNNHTTKTNKNRHSSGQSLTAASSNRCRSVTLSESSHTRCDTSDYTPVPMPSSSETPMAGIASGCIYLSEECNFGRSLLGDVCPSYTSHFVLHGTNDRRFLKEPFTQLHQDLKISVKNSVLDEPVTEATCIVADTDNWSVHLFSCKSKCPDEGLKPLRLTSSPLVCNLIESVYELGKLKMSPEFCLLHLEDQLQSIYLKSQRLAEYIRVCRKVYSKELSTLLGLDINDMPLLLAVARTHSPQLFQRVVL